MIKNSDAKGATQAKWYAVIVKTPHRDSMLWFHHLRPCGLSGCRFLLHVGRFPRNLQPVWSSRRTGLFCIPYRDDWEKSSRPAQSCLFCKCIESLLCPLYLQNINHVIANSNLIHDYYLSNLQQDFQHGHCIFHAVSVVLHLLILRALVLAFACSLIFWMAFIPLILLGGTLCASLHCLHNTIKLLTGYEQRVTNCLQIVYIRCIQHRRARHLGYVVLTQTL